jgi:hypothetical protein
LGVGSSRTVPEDGFVYIHTKREITEIIWLRDDNSYLQTILIKDGKVYQNGGTFSIEGNRIRFKDLEIGSFFTVEEMSRVVQPQSSFISMPFSTSKLIFSTPGEDPDNAEYITFRRN